MFDKRFKEGIDKRAVLTHTDSFAFRVFLTLMCEVETECISGVDFEKETTNATDGNDDTIWMMPYFNIDVNRTTLIKVLEYAEEYQTDNVRLKVDHIFSVRVRTVYTTSVKHASVVLQDLNMAECFGLQQTRSVCVGWLCMVDGWGACLGRDYKELSMETKYDILTGLISRFDNTYTSVSLNSENDWKLLFEETYTFWMFIKRLCGCRCK